MNDQAQRNVLVSGSTGLIGSGLVPMLEKRGWRVIRLVRSLKDTPEPQVRWTPRGDWIDFEGLAADPPEAVIHLAGENIVGRWTEAKKRQIRESRVRGTRLLSQALAELEVKPKVLVCASALGYYGDRGEEELDEASAAGQGFLAGVCKEWEAAADPAREAGIRTVHVRVGMVLSAEGGALAKMLTPFKWGLGGVVGDGRQYMSWISREDIAGIFTEAVENPELSGPVNGGSPNPVTNREFTETLGKVLGRPTFLPAPGFAVRLAMGEMADELLLASTRMIPRKIMGSPYKFRDLELEPALRRILGRQ